MKIKNKITIALLSSFAIYASANDYFVIVDKEKNKYEVVENPLWASTTSTFTEWEDTGVINNCDTWTPAILNQKNNFQQNANCDFEQLRYENIREVNSINGSYKIVEQIPETQFISKTTNRDIFVTNDNPVLFKDNYNCSNWTPDPADIYLGTTFEQERYCDVDMLQHWIYSDFQIEISTWDEIYTENSGYETQSSTGTKSWDAIADLYTSWEYTGSVDNCDMWTPTILNQKNNFQQTANCDFEQSRTRTEREENPNTGSVNITGVYTEYQDLIESDNRDIIVSSANEVEEGNSYNCSNWTPEANTITFGTTFEQSRTCSIDVMKEWTYSLDSSPIGTWEERYTNTNKEETQNVTGTLAYSSCNDILNSGNSTGNGVYSINIPQGNIDVYCDMTTDGGGWTLLLNHNINYGAFSSESEARLSNVNQPSLSTNKYSILNYLESFRVNGKFEFKLGSTNVASRQIWKQSSNPTSEYVSGYEPISIQSNSNFWGGLEYGFGGPSFMDGSVYHSNWYYAIGSYTYWGSGGTVIGNTCYGIPLSDDMIGVGCGVHNINLWIR